MAGRAVTGRSQRTSAIKVVITGPFAAGKSTLVRTVSEVTVLSTERAVSGGDRAEKPATTVAMDYGRITIDEDLVLYLFGTPGQDRFDFMWDVLGEGMLGYVLLIDADRPESLIEAVPILNAFRRTAKVPFVVALNRAETVDPADERGVREALSLAADVPVIACDVRDRESVKSVLLELLYAVMEPVDRAAALG
ncbi:MAG: GTP-binding protein [Pseudonocardiales bacterium]|nr:MAG: GTP-binding protein [Pseudonocardiales bacterium]